MEEAEGCGHAEWETADSEFGVRAQVFMFIFEFVFISIFLFMLVFVFVFVFEGRGHIRPKIWWWLKVWLHSGFGVRAQVFMMQHVQLMRSNGFLTRAIVWKIIVCCFQLTGQVGHLIFCTLQIAFLCHEYQLTKHHGIKNDDDTDNGDDVNHQMVVIVGFPWPLLSYKTRIGVTGGSHGQVMVRQPASGRLEKSPKKRRKSSKLPWKA